MATTSTSRRLTASTIASTYGRLIVGPTWRSLIWAIVKPSSAGGRPATGTSTRTTRAVRRALTKPQSVTSTAAIATARADGSTSGARAIVPGRIASSADDREQAEVAHESEHEQRREQAHADQADPGELDAEAAAPAVASAEAEWQR